MKLLLILVTAIPLVASAASNNSKPMKETDQAPKKISQAESTPESTWKETLTPEQYHILRRAGTEAPNGEVYAQFKKQGEGAYYCAGCGTKIFSSDQKFDSHCGWPSFWDPADIDSVELRTDNSFGRPRTEVICSNCKGHLGHVFKGEGFDTPTDQRFCINGTVLVYVPKD